MEMELTEREMTPTENKMGTKPIGRLLLGMAWPMILSMLVQAFYNIVDSIFVSRIPLMGKAALSALGYAYPIQMLMIAVSVGTAVGMNSLISRRLGAKRFDEANKAASNGISLQLLSMLPFMALGIFGSKFIIGLFTSDATVVDLAARYLSICCTFSLGIFQAVGLERVMNAQGKTIASMIAQLSGGILNIVLDRILVLGFGPIPAMGIEGAAIATVIGQWVSMTVAILILVFGKHEVRVRFRDMPLKASCVREIYQVGLPSIVMQAIGVVMLSGMNLILGGFGAVTGTDAVAVFGVYYKLQSIVFMPVFGVTNAAISIFGYNFGARSKKRLLETLRLTIFIALLFMLTGLLLFQLLPEPLMQLFNVEGETLHMGVQALRTLSLCFPIAAVCISVSTLFGAVGNGMYSMWLSLIRQLFVLLPAAYLLSRIFGTVPAVWWSFPIAEIAGLITAAILFVRLYRNKIKPLDTEEGLLQPNLQNVG